MRTIGVDIGGTKISAGVVSGWKIEKYIEVPTPKTKKEFIKRLFSVIDKVFDPKIKKIGAGFPAPVVKGEAHEVQNINSLGKINIKKIIEQKYKVKCKVENDASCFILAEQKFGAAKGKKNAAGITLGTGLGCGIMINGKLFSGSTGAAGEISKAPVDRDKLENFVNADFLKRTYGKQPEEIYEMARKGSKFAKNAWKRYGQNLGVALSLVVEAYDPEIIVLGGKIAKAYPYFGRYLMPEIRKHTFRRTSSKLIIAKSKLENSGVIGAAML